MPQSSVPHLSFDLKGATFNRRLDGAAAARLRAQVRDEGLRQGGHALGLGLAGTRDSAAAHARRARGAGHAASADVRFLAARNCSTTRYSSASRPPPSPPPDAVRPATGRRRRRRRHGGGGRRRAPSAGWRPRRTGRRAASREWFRRSPRCRRPGTPSSASASRKEPASARLAAGVAAIDAAEHGVRVGIIDVLEAWRGGPCATRWPWQRAALSTLLWLTRAANPRGITALPPRKYAARFEGVHAVRGARAAHLVARLAPVDVAAVALDRVDVRSTQR